jgi:hypothetical protein
MHMQAESAGVVNLSIPHSVSQSAYVITTIMHSVCRLNVIRLNVMAPKLKPRGKSGKAKCTFIRVNFFSDPTKLFHMLFIP